VGDAEGAGLTEDAGDGAFVFEGAEVAHDGVGAGELEMGLDVADAGPVALHALVQLNET
jgi:hypothetical protein